VHVQQLATDILLQCRNLVAVQLRESCRLACLAFQRLAAFQAPKPCCLAGRPQNAPVLCDKRKLA
jgi:hypothetical protein